MTPKPKWATGGILLLVLVGQLGYALGDRAGQQAAEQDARQVEQIISQLKHDLVQAYIHRSADELDRIYAEDFTVTDAQGTTRTKADEMANLKTETSTLTSGRYDVVKVRVFSDVAVMSGHGHLQGTGPSGPFQTSYYSFNVFVRRDGRWQYAAAFTP
jgi:ketosteroid isomerase-like protein